MATRTKQITLDEIQETFREQYKRIYDYGHELLRANVGSSVCIQVQRSPDFDNEAQTSSMTNYCIFQKIYVCLEACKQSFQYCRSFIGLDGCFLKTPQVGQFLTAIGWDPNDQMLPIAYVVVEDETKDSWTWFLNHLTSDIGIERMGKSTFMSDQQNGLLPAYEDAILEVDNQFYVRHLYRNFRKRYWSRSRFAFNSKVDTLVNNMSKSFDSAIVDVREKPIVMMLEKIRVKLMTRWEENRELAQNYPGTILLKIRMKLERMSRSAGQWQPYWSVAQKYEGLDLEPFVANCYKKEAYLKCYELVIHPLNGPDLRERIAHGDIMPPPYRRSSHRPGTLPTVPDPPKPPLPPQTGRKEYRAQREY
ncbi:uncharacterized protein [Arachis hypogaea]|uniref:uncharacterized protein n=1 Tax=Arachis hypogaea TaxID=3818 RepID=UPI003B211B51